MIVKCLEGEPLPVYGTGANVRDWVYVADHAAALLLVAERGAAGETYLIGGDNGLSNLAVVRTICAAVDRCVGKAGFGARDGLIQFVSDRPGHDFRYAIDSTKIREKLGWRPTEPFEGALEKTVNWYVANAVWWRPIRDRIYRGQRLGLNPVSA